jgi:Putative Ig domain
MAGCTSSKSSTPTISVSLTPSATQTLGQGGTVAITASLTNDTKAGGVTWSLTGAGTLTASTTTSVTYNAPASVTSASTATVKATSVDDTSKTATLTIDLVPISVSLSPSATQTLEQGNTVAVTATVANDGAAGGVTWSLTGAGALSNQTSTSVTYTAPASIASASTATVKATAANDTSKTASLTMDLVPPPSITGSSTPDGNVGVSYAGSVTETGGVGPFTWVKASGTLPAGLALGTGTSSSVTISGIPTATGPSTFTVKVTDKGGYSATSSTLSITINAALALSITTLSPLSDGVMNSQYSQTLAATGGLAPYTWALHSGSNLPAGLTLSTAGVISGKPSATGTTTFTVDVTDSETPTALTASKQFSITINPAPANACASAPTGDEAKLSGQYAFFVQGFEGSGGGTPVAIAASFGADGTGKIADGGDLDISNASGHSHLTIGATGSLYTVGADGTSSGDLGCVQLKLSDSTTEVFRFSLGKLSSNVYTKGHIIEFDDTTGTGTRGSGLLEQQTVADFAISKLSAHYAFGLDGVDSTGGHVAVGGSFALNTSTGAITSGVFDLDDAGIVPGKQTIDTTTSPKITAPSATTGRATASFASGIYSYNFATYIVNASQMFAVTTDTFGATNPIASGRVIVTGSSFSQSSLSGYYVIHLSGSGGGTANANIGLLNFTAGAGNGTLYEYDGVGTTLKTNTVTGGAYTVDATTGRVTLSNVGSNPPTLYLTTPTDGVSVIIVGSDGSAIFGYAEASSGSGFTTAGLAGKYFYGTEDPSDNTVQDEIGVVTVASDGTINGTSDQSGSSTPYLKSAQSLGGSFSITNINGVGNVGANTIAITNGTKLFFILSDGSEPAVIYVVEKQ